MKELLYVLSLSFFVVSCKSDKITPIDADCPELVSFSEKIEPLINTNCATSGCHAAGFTSPTLTTHAEIAANANQILVRIQKDPTSNQLMPFGGPKLADSLIQQFKCWVNQGSLDN